MNLGRILAAEDNVAPADVDSGADAVDISTVNLSEVSPRSLRAIFAGAGVRTALLAMIVGQLVMTMIMVITPIYMNSLGYNIQAISSVIMAHTLGMFALSGGTGWLIDRTGRVTMIVAGALLLMAAAILAPISTQLIALMFSLFLLGLGWNFCFIAGSSLLTDSLSANERGRTQGANDMMVALASGAGSLSTGMLYAFGGMSLIAAIGVGFAIALLCFTAWSTRRIAVPV
jgi:MFS family permease